MTDIPNDVIESMGSMALHSHPNPISIPITLTRSYTIQSIPTDLYVQLFADRLVFGVTQLDGRIGNFLLCDAIPSAVDPKAVDYQVSNLLGSREEPMLSVYIRRLTERIIRLRGNMNTTTVVLEISLQKQTAKDKDMFTTIIDLLVNLYQHALAQSGSTN